MNDMIEDETALLGPMDRKFIFKNRSDEGLDKSIVVCKSKSLIQLSNKIDSYLYKFIYIYKMLLIASNIAIRSK